MRICVVGAGVYGLVAARRLAAAGARVTVLEAAVPGHAGAASGGLTRVLRLEYGAASRYTELTVRGLEAWQALERELGVRVYRQAGVLFLVAEGADDAWERASARACAEVGAPAEELTPAEVARRWPAIAPDGLLWAHYNPRGGFLHARRAVLALAGAARAGGVAIRTGATAVALEPRGVRLAGGELVAADRVLLASGAWAPALEPSLPIVATRQHTLYLDGDPGAIPVFGEGAPFAHYGFPAHDGLGMKVGSHVTGPPADPSDPAARIPDEEVVERILAYVRRRFPRVPAGREAVRSVDVCFYAMAPGEDPVVERLDERTVVCAGFSGHGFKFAPVVGAAAADLLLDREPGLDLRPFARAAASRPA